MKKRRVIRLRIRGWEPSRAITSIRRMGSISVAEMIRHLHNDDIISRGTGHKNVNPDQTTLLRASEAIEFERMVDIRLHFCCMAALDANGL